MKLILLLIGLSLQAMPEIPNLNGPAYLDRVLSVPMAPPLTSGTYSGYLKVSDTKALHYYFVESQNDVYNDPLIIWTNGGPGCSSMLGLLQEHGPYVMPDIGNTFDNNPHSWNIKANVLYVEQPAGVGFSAYGSDDDLKQDDYKSSTDFFTAVQSFYKKFPTFKSHDLWITGESYGGIYVPWLAKRIVDFNAGATAADKINLKGIVVGNGVADYHYDTTMAYLNQTYYAAMYPPSMRKVFEDNKCRFYEGFIPDPEQQPQACYDSFDKWNLLLQNVNIYDIYRFCYIPPSREFTTTIGGEERTYKAGMTKYEYTPWKFGTHSTGEHYANLLRAENEGLLGETPPCVYSAGASAFLNNQEVRTALHIPDGVQTWEMCAGSPFDYSYGANGSHWIYPELKTAGIKILFFSGDTDGAVGTLGIKG